MAWLWSNRTPAFTVTRSFTVTESLTKSAAVLNRPPSIDGARDIDLERLAAVVDELHAAGDDADRAVLAAFDLGADPELMVGAEPVRLVAVEDGFRIDPIEHQARRSAERCRSGRW